MTVTARQLNRATLQRQLLLERERLDVAAAVHRIVAMQAQEAASPYVALWNRLADFDPADLDAAFASHAVVRASLMRITLHAVHRDDYPAFHNAMVASLRRSRLHDMRFKVSGLSIAEMDEILPDLLKFTAKPRTKAEIEERLATLVTERLHKQPHERVWWAFRTFAPLMHVPTGGPWSFTTKSSYTTGRTSRQDRLRSIQQLALRYLSAFGPASALDVAQFTLLQRPVAREALQALGNRVRRVEGPDGAELFDVPDGTCPPADTPAQPRLMAMWDSVLLAHADRGRIVPAEYKPAVTRKNGDVLPTLLVDGYVAGVWRPLDGGIEATAFRWLTDEDWAGLATEAKAMVALLSDRQPDVYRRYARWWAELPAAEVRLLT
jgi:hypothetical protein